MRTFIVVKFPRTGLGNMLLVWARAKIFADTGGFRLLLSSWTRIHYGAWLRNERKKRLYYGCFSKPTWLEKIKAHIYPLLLPTVDESQVIPTRCPENSIVVFSKVTIDQTLFRPLWGHRDQIKFWVKQMLSSATKENVDKQLTPEIAIHVRRGDFKIGNPITPISFFLELILLIRETLKFEMPVTVFSDGSDEELAEILSLPSVSRSPEQPDIADILMMAKSKILILSRSSTFSYWGAFLSEAMVLKHKEDWQPLIRPPELQSELFEEKVDPLDPASVQLIKNYLITNIKRFV